MQKYKQITKKIRHPWRQSGILGSLFATHLKLTIHSASESISA